MATFTKLYLTTKTAGYSPATLRGEWNQTTAVVTKMLDSGKQSDDAIVVVLSAETNVSDTFDVLLYRGVSGPLAAQTIACNIDVMLGVYESNAAANFNWHIHIFVTEGDSDTVRATLVDNYVEAAGTNEWGDTVTTSGKALNAVQAVDVGISAGDRLVVEIGYIARNTSATSYTGRLYYGTTVGGIQVADLTASADGRSLAGYISFSNAVTEVAPTARLTQAPLRVLRDADTAVRTARLTQASLRVLYKSPPVIAWATENIQPYREKVIPTPY